MTLDQIATRASTVRMQHAQYATYVARCERILQQAHDFGWKVTLMLNGERAVRNAESLLGTHLRVDFPPSTALSKLIYGT